MQAPQYTIGQRVQLQFDGEPLGTIENVLRADTTYWYRIRLDQGGYKTPGEVWVKPAPEETTDSE